MSTHSRSFTEVVGKIAEVIRDDFSACPARIASLEDEVKIPDTGPYAYFDIRPGATVVKEIGGGPVSRRTGILFVSIFNNVNEGSSEQLSIADQLCELFEYSTHGVVNFREASLRAVGIRNDRYEYALEIPFYAE